MKNAHALGTGTQLAGSLTETEAWKSPP